MAQIETTGGGFIDSGDRRIIRKVVVNTGGTTSAPGAPGGYALTSVTKTDEPGGIQRAVYEYTRGGEGDASYNIYGKRIELAGGTREVPIATHQKFATLTDEQVAEVQQAVEATDPDTSEFTADQSLLYSFLSRGIEYFLAPSIVGRITTIESGLPGLAGIAKAASPPELNNPAGTFWVCTAINATPIGDRYEVTREFTLNFSSFSGVQDLYNW